MSSLEEKLAEPGFSPKQEQTEELFTLLTSSDQKISRAAERALARLGSTAAELARTRFRSAEPPLRGRLSRLIGRMAGSGRQPELAGLLLDLLDDADAKTRRNAIIALGKLGGSPGLPADLVEQRLLARWCTSELAEQRSLAAALGKVGGAPALALFEREHSRDAELNRLIEEARLKIERTRTRSAPGLIDPRRTPRHLLRVRFHCRAGLEAILGDELGSELSPRPRPPARVEARWAGSLERLQAARTALRFGFPLPSRRLGPKEDLAVAVADALTAPRSRALLRAFTIGPIRFRLEWAGAGHRRALSFRVASEVARRWPELRNDPTRSLWEVVVRESREPRTLKLEIWPRGLPDTRFAYRRRDLPAASHPTIAAALARVAGVRADDVCWDPFVGSGLELCERGLLGPYARLLGSDSDPVAIEAARENLAAAGLQRFTLAVGDVREYSPPARPSLILTNPPMGRRLLRGEELPALLQGFLKRAAELLLEGGRIVWINPLPEAEIPSLRAAGLRCEMRQRLDMGGFHAELQLLVRAAAKK